MKLSSSKKKGADVHASSTPGAALDNGVSCGLIKIHEGVIATIVRKSACSVEGVSRITGNSFVDNIAEIVGSKKMQDRSIVVSMGNNNVSVELAINVEYGIRLPEVAANVQSAVAAEIERLTGLAVSKVNVIVREMEEPRQEE